jgi:hypothetical protein
MSLTKVSYAMIQGDPLNVIDFGAVGDGTTDDTVAIQAALNALSNNGAIVFVPSKTYKTTSVLTLNPNLYGILIQGNGATIKASHNGNGLNITSTNENYSRHTINNLNITGPNVAYPTNSGELAGTSTGAALKIGPDDTTNTPGGYLVSVNNCRFQQFYQGLYLQNALLCNFNGGYIAFNQYGVYVDSGETNANTFNSVAIRENRVFGVYSSPRTGGALTNASANVFYGCTFETNIPYDSSAGGYPSTFDGTLGFGIKLWNSYDWLFDGCYFENQNYSVMLSGSSDNNQFRNCRFDGGGSGSPVRTRPGGIYFDGGTLSNNVFQNCQMISFSHTIVSVTWDDPTTCLYNQFLDNSGFVFDIPNIGKYSNIRNNRYTQGTGISGQKFGLIQMPFQGYVDNPAEGTTPGTITGIGTATATLNTFGFGEVQFGNLITGNTTISTISGQQPGQILTLINYQTAYTVTIKSAASGTGQIVLTGFSDVVFNGYGQMLVLYVTSGLGGNRCYEIGRNF